MDPGLNPKPSYKISNRATTQKKITHKKLIFYQKIKIKNTLQKFSGPERGGLQPSPPNQSLNLPGQKPK